MGIADDKIVIFPSWEPDGTKFISGSAGERWLRHRKYSSSFEETWLESGRMNGLLPYPDLRDISAGIWREVLYSSEDDYPAVHPNHEKRKYLCTANGRSGTSGSNGSHRMLLKFAGLGAYGREKFIRGRILYEAGYSPGIYGFANGFLAVEYMNGRPACKKDLDTKFIDRMAEYLAFLKREFPAAPDSSFEDLCYMIRRNTKIGLGPDWAERLGGLGQYRSMAADSSGTALDGMMMLHEWIVTPAGILKTDNLDHYASQFYPGCLDVAWDIAGAISEVPMGKAEKEYFLTRYSRASGDRSIGRRLTFFMIAYLSYRLGLARFHAADLGSSPDGLKFLRLAERYSALLKSEISLISQGYTEKERQ
jgi:hypothetical protein